MTVVGIDRTVADARVGACAWRGVAGNRSGKQCRERWHNHLDPRVKKGDWSSEEDRLIITMQVGAPRHATPFADTSPLAAHRGPCRLAAARAPTRAARPRPHRGVMTPA